MRRPGPALCAAVMAAGLLSGVMGSGMPAAVRADAGPQRAATPGRASTAFPSLQQGPLNVTADEILVDNTGTQLTARGHVRLTYARGVATANALTLRRSERIAAFSGNAVITDPHGKAAGDTIVAVFTAANEIGRLSMAGNASAETKDYALQADHIVADRAAGTLESDGHITMFAAPDLIVNGDRVRYRQHDRYGVVSGHVAASNRLGRILGDWMEFYQQQQQATIHGPVTAEVYGATITGRLAQIDVAKSTAVFSDHVQVIRRQGTLTADRVTILYKTRRLVAQGTTHVHFTELEGAAP